MSNQPLCECGAVLGFSEVSREDIMRGTKWTVRWDVVCPSCGFRAEASEWRAEALRRDYPDPIPITLTSASLPTNIPISTTVLDELSRPAPWGGDDEEEERDWLAEAIELLREVAAVEEECWDMGDYAPLVRQLPKELQERIAAWIAEADDEPI